MSRDDDPQREDGVLRERFSAFNSAILQVNASLDLNTVLARRWRAPTG